MGRSHFPFSDKLSSDFGTVRPSVPGPVQYFPRPIIFKLWECFAIEIHTLYVLCFHLHLIHLLLLSFIA